MKKSNYRTGHFVEKIALVWLLFKGYRPVALNYVTGRGTGAGEIDLIVKRSNTLVFVEVKKRQDLGVSAEAITKKVQKRIARAAEAFIVSHPKYAFLDVRFDAVLFAKGFVPHHIQDAWRL